MNVRWYEIKQWWVESAGYGYIVISSITVIKGNRFIQEKYNTSNIIHGIQILQ